MNIINLIILHKTLKTKVESIIAIIVIILKRALRCLRYR